MQNNLSYLEDTDRNVIKEIISTTEKLNDDIKDRMLKEIEKQFELKFFPRYFKISNITTNENRNTEYPGFSWPISTELPITVIKGPTGTGKTTTFEKIIHPFLKPIPLRLRTSRWVTISEMELQEINGDNAKYQVKFHSQRGFKGERFQVAIERNGFYSKLPNSEKFLKESLLIDYELNNLMFIPETSNNSIVPNYCTQEKIFRKLFRFPTVNYILDTIEAEEYDLTQMINQIHGTLSGLLVELDRIKHFSEIHRKSLKKDKFLQDNERSLMEARKIFNELKDEKKIEEREIIRKIRKLNIKEKKIQKKLEELDRLLIPRAKDRIELFRGQQLRQCWECGSIIPPDEFRRRIKNKPPLCYICGTGEYDYSIEMSTIPEEDISELKKEQNNLKNEMERIISQIDKQTRAHAEFLPKPDKFSIQIWKKAIIFRDDKGLFEEIKIAKKRISETESELMVLKENHLDINSQYKKEKGRLDEFREDYEQLENIKKEILELEEEKYQELKDEVFDNTNQALMDLSYESAGRIFFDDEGILTLETEIVLDEEKNQRMNRKQKYIEADFSPGQFRKIDFAFTLSLIKTMVKRKRIPINSLFIDSLNYLSSDDGKFLLEGLANLPDFKVIIFALEEPTYLSKDIYEVVHITRNSRVVKPDILRDLNKHRTLDEFFT